MSVESSDSEPNASPSNWQPNLSQTSLERVMPGYSEMFSDTLSPRRLPFRDEGSCFHTCFKFDCID